MLSAFGNSLKIPELRKKIFYTFGILAICRVAANIPCPGIDPVGLENMFEAVQKNVGGAGGVLDTLNLFTGGALQRFAVGALGIMPYISAAIVMQLMTPVVPQLEKLQREGESGRAKITQWTRYMTLGICLVQGFLLAKAMENPSQMLGIQVDPIVAYPGIGFQIMTVIILTCGTMILMWLGEQITDKGIGNGASLIITISIIEQLPSAITKMWSLWRTGGTGDTDFTLIHVIVMLGLFVIVTAATVALTLGVRKVPLQFARQQVARGSGQPGGRQASFFPLKVNFANVMPIIFASAILMFPPLLINNVEFLRHQTWLQRFFDYASMEFLIFYAFLIIIFCFFWVANQFNTIRIADDLKRQGAFVPGIRPGKPTADYLDRTMTRITTAGAVFLALLALLPMIVSDQLSIDQMISQYFGGASLLIICGVMLDTMRRVEAHLMMHHYDGFMKKGRLRSRSGRGG
jgi:preprotein translocase subunit SecY